MKQARTKLLLSLVSLLLCMSMLAGSTFAWFTDSASTGVNKIQAGNLDMTLSYSKDFANWSAVTEQTNMFDEALWEPGHTEVVYLKIKNEGSLAFRYRLSVAVAAETAGTNVNGETFALSDYISYGVAENVQNSYADRDAARAAVSAPQTLGTPYKTSHANGYPHLLSGEEIVLALVAFMPETVGNEANYMTGSQAPEIDLGITVDAIQHTYEQDSFGDDYDETDFAAIDSERHLAELLQQGYVQAGASDFNATVAGNAKTVVTEPLTVDQAGFAIANNAVVDFNGNTVTRATASGNGLKLTNYDANVTLENGSFVSKKGGNIFRVEAVNALTIRNSSFVCEAAGSTGNTLFQITPSTENKKMTIVFENCTFDKGIVDIKGYNCQTEYDVTFKNCRFIWDDKNGSSFVQGGNYSYGTFRFEDCDFTYTHWWSGDLIKVDNSSNPSTVSLKNIRVTGSGDRKPYVVSGNSSLGKKNLTVTCEGTNSYTYKGEVQNWEDMYKAK